MQTILEYLKRRDKQKYDGDVSIHHTGGDVDGIEVFDGDEHFILSLRDADGRYTWKDATNEAKKLGMRLGTVSEWDVVYKHLDEINKLIEDNLIGHLIGVGRFPKQYWTSDGGLNSRRKMFFSEYFGKCRDENMDALNTLRCFKNA